MQSVSIAVDVGPGENRDPPWDRLVKPHGKKAEQRTRAMTVFKTYFRLGQKSGAHKKSVNVLHHCLICRGGSRILVRGAQ